MRDWMSPIRKRVMQALDQWYEIQTKKGFDKQWRRWDALMDHWSIAPPKPGHSLFHYPGTPASHYGPDGDPLRYFLSVVLLLFVLDTLLTLDSQARNWFRRQFILMDETRISTLNSFTSLLYHVRIYDVAWTFFVVWSIGPRIVHRLGAKCWWLIFLGGGVAANMWYVLDRGQRYRTPRDAPWQAGANSCCYSAITSYLLLFRDEIICGSRMAAGHYGHHGMKIPAKGSPADFAGAGMSASMNSPVIRAGLLAAMFVLFDATSMFGYDIQIPFLTSYSHGRLDHREIAPFWGPARADGGAADCCGATFGALVTYMLMRRGLVRV